MTALRRLRTSASRVRAIGAVAVIALVSTTLALVDGRQDRAAASVSSTASSPNSSPNSPPTATPQATGRLLRDGTGLYPRVIRLEHNGAANGRVLAGVVSFVGDADGIGAIYESTDDGATFEQVGTVADPEAADGQGLCCATMFELPRQIGAMPAGTLLWAASVGADDRPMSLRIWKSHDVGRTWSYLSMCATAPNTGGLWEPEFSVAADGRLVCHYADETDSAHSQRLMRVRSSDGTTWVDRVPTVASPTFGHRPGMPVVRALPNGEYVMTYEVCGLGGQYDCVVHIRRSPDGWSWGTHTWIGTRPETVDGKYFTHTPTIAWGPSASNGNGRLMLVGQILQNRDGSVAADNGRTVFVNTENANGFWYELPAPVAVDDPYNDYCPNYSSPLLLSRDGERLLELASDYDGTICKTYYDTGSAIGTRDASGVAGGATYRLVSALSGHCLDVAGDSQDPGGNVQQWTCNGLGPQNFVFTARGDGYFTLTGQNSGLCVDVENGSSDAGANVRQWTCNGSAAQDWRLVNVGRGYYTLVSRASAHCLDVSGGSTSPGANVQQWLCNDLQPQIWRLERR